MNVVPLRHCLPLLLAAVAPNLVRAQCTNPWLLGDGIQGANAAIEASTVWDPDGAGPLPAVVVLGGSFHAIGPIAANCIATWDPATGSFGALGAGVAGPLPLVRALAVLPNHDLIAAGNFTTAGGAPASNIARWNGSSWSALGNGLNLIVDALTLLPNGDLVAGGEFTQSGALVCARVARWNGASWAPIGAGFDGVIAEVQTLATLANGDLVAGGRLTSSGGVFAVARWNGAVWQNLGSNLGGSVRSMLRLGNGDLLVGGDIGVNGGPTDVARWNGTTWSSTGYSGLPVYALAERPNGEILAASRQLPSITDHGLALQNGGVWSPLSPDPSGWIVTMTNMPDGRLFVGGAFPGVAAVPAANAVVWDGAAWTPIHAGINGNVAAATTAANGDLIVGGTFSVIGGVPAAFLARRSGTIWSAIGSGPGGPVNAIVALPNGDIVAGGSFGGAPLPAARYLARASGGSWLPLGTGVDGEVRALAVMPNGDLVAGGLFGNAGGQPAQFLARWDGTNWSPLGPGPGGVPRTLSVLADGRLVSGGSNFVSAWDGTTWAPIGPATLGFAQVGEVRALHELPGGSLLAVGASIGLFDGSTWSRLAYLNGPAYATLELPNHDLLFGGSFTVVEALPVSRLVRWNGSTFVAVGGGIDDSILTMTALADGTAVLGGAFQVVGGQVSASLAELGTSCPAQSSVLGPGCSGSGGANVLAVETLPWIGGTYRSRATGMPSNGFAVRVLGLATIAPTSLPFGGPGCQGLVRNDLLEVYVAANGAVLMQLAVPATATLVGLSLYEQVVPFEFDLAGNLTLTSTNGLALVVGAF